METRLIFIRHAQSIWNAQNRWQGNANPPLADSGREQARMLARRLSTWKIDAIYTSDLHRAAETARILGEALGIEPVEDSIWRERALGALEGLTTEEIAERYPEAWASRINGPITGVPGSEPQESVAARAAAGSSRLLTLHPGQTVAVVSHGGMILSTLVYLLGLPPSGHGLLTVGGNTSISRVVTVDGHSRLKGLNDIAHLEMSMT
ncbi:MAG: phosphoglycerate mutase family protein [Anaerolineae bacterium]|nr:phosphoglycerate mutase family protein [Anaerolineae bacterium]RIK23516.1 MAG: histidine phosphatase family protein [Anaerolineae bacterium]